MPDFVGASRWKMEMTIRVLTEILGLVKTRKAFIYFFGFEIHQICLGCEKLRENLRKKVRDIDRP